MRDFVIASQYQIVILSMLSYERHHLQAKCKLHEYIATITVPLPFFSAWVIICSLIVWRYLNQIEDTSTHYIDTVSFFRMKV
jgi:hypothetical protein